ncbi:Fucoxanthin-chlorophyll a-c binding protein [Seminavis robusta]|uniref:Fucoxanthin-chlorophyll a-c binding protein n=1 Tax=Seminavis robusta TaxID=568900 RepID=A0A9N8EN55_9STRA|nr:Fucoxanthin-chlorophyll a-c binding protein [Seminavis robusta]|eukprot:Sro1451_g273830.1 Fucoxanthin-chlorophyll a-c binding protein (307) ;mRNA; r:2428-3348
MCGVRTHWLVAIVVDKDSFAQAKCIESWILWNNFVTTKSRTPHFPPACKLNRGYLQHSNGSKSNVETKTQPSWSATKLKTNRNQPRTPALHQSQFSVKQNLISELSKMKTAIIASLIASAAAFAPSKQAPSTSVSLNAFEDDFGATAPLGFFDPLGLVEDGDEAKFNRLRYVEVKHGRICMLAVVGYIYTYAGNRIEGDIDLSGTSFEDIPAGLEALGAIPALGMLQLVGFIGFLEMFVMKDVNGDGEFPGDFRNGYIDFGWDRFSDEEKLNKRTIELNQGRAAMMGILGLMVHEVLGYGLLPDAE